MQRILKAINLCFILLSLYCVGYSTRQINSQDQKEYPTNSGNKFTNYIQNRIMDLRDIFSIQLVWGLNVEAKAQISRMGAGLYWEAGSTHPIDFSGEVGLRSGEFGSHSADDFTLLIFSTDQYQPSDRQKNNRAEFRRKTEDKKVPEKSPASWTRLGAAAGLFIVGVRVEFNPGELLDFLLGIFAIDIYSDDAYQNIKVNSN